MSWDLPKHLFASIKCPTKIQVCKQEVFFISFSDGDQYESLKVTFCYNHFKTNDSFIFRSCNVTVSNFQSLRQMYDLKSIFHLPN